MKNVVDNMKQMTPSLSSKSPLCALHSCSATRLWELLRREIPVKDGAVCAAPIACHRGLSPSAPATCLVAWRPPALAGLAGVAGMAGLVLALEHQGHLEGSCGAEGVLAEDVAS